MTLLGLASSGNRPNMDQATPQDAEQHNGDIIVILASLVTTCITFTLTVLGAGSAVAGLKKVVARISRTGRISAVAAMRSAQGEHTAPG